MKILRQYWKRFMDYFYGFRRRHTMEMVIRQYVLIRKIKRRGKKLEALLKEDHHKHRIQAWFRKKYANKSSYAFVNKLFEETLRNIA